MKTATSKDVHNECDQEAEILVKEAQSVIAKAQKKDNILVEKLKEMGFGNSTSIKDNEKAMKLATDALRYKLLYPQNNFLTEEAIEKICKKYGLLFAKAEYFIGEIPEKNQIEIANFKIATEDKMVIAIDRTEFKKNIGRMKAISKKLKTSGFFETIALAFERVAVKLKYEKAIAVMEAKDSTNFSIRKELKPEYHIAATPDQLTSLAGKKVIGDYKVVDEDPVVFCKVDGGYLQVSAWGDESSLDEFKTATKS